LRQETTDGDGWLVGSIEMASMTILGVCGSLQRQSGNLALLNAATAAAPPNVEVVVFDGLGELPHFNPDIEASGAPESVMRCARRFT
jgi:chromate reductase, NAD(P)H dehydrogenase (quinone)